VIRSIIILQDFTSLSVRNATVSSVEIAEPFGKYMDSIEEEDMNLLASSIELNN
jgi:hypothetical protein